MTLREKLDLIRNLSFASGVLDTLGRVFKLPENADAGAKEAARRLDESLAWLMDKPVSEYPPAPLMWPSPKPFDPCEGCGPICGNSACPKRLQVTCGTIPQA